MSTEQPGIQDRLDRYVGALRGADERWTGDLNPALDRDEVQRILGNFVAEPVPELVDLWSWHNGQHLMTQQPLFWDTGFFHALTEEAVAEFRQGAGEFAEIAAEEGLFWPSIQDAIPILYVAPGSSGGPWVFVDSGAGPDRGYVFHGNTHDLGPARRLFRSLGDAVGTAHEMVARGRWYLGDELVLRDERRDRRA